MLQHYLFLLLLLVLKECVPVSRGLESNGHPNLCKQANYQRCGLIVAESFPRGFKQKEDELVMSDVRVPQLIK